MVTTISLASSCCLVFGSSNCHDDGLGCVRVEYTVKTGVAQGSCWGPPAACGMCAGGVGVLTHALQWVDAPLAGAVQVRSLHACRQRCLGASRRTAVEDAQCACMGRGKDGMQVLPAGSARCSVGRVMCVSEELMEDARARKSCEPELCWHVWSVSQDRPVPHVTGHQQACTRSGTQRHAPVVLCLPCCFLLVTGAGLLFVGCRMPAWASSSGQELHMLLCPGVGFTWHVITSHRCPSTRHECCCRHQTIMGSAPAVCWHIDPVSVGCNSAS